MFPRDIILYYLLSISEEFPIVRAEEVQGLFILFDFWEAAYRFIEAVVGGIVIALAYFAYHHLAFAWFAVKAVIEVLLHADALSWA